MAHEAGETVPKRLVLRFIFSVSMGGDMGDVADAVDVMLREHLGLGDLDWRDLRELAGKLRARGIPSLYADGE